MSAKSKIITLYFVIIIGITGSASYFVKNENFYRDKHNTSPEVSETTQIDKVIDDKWKNNRLETGELPYIDYLGDNAFSGNACIKINAPLSSDVLVIIKDGNGKMKKHAYIRSNGTYTFHLSQGMYESFFYYGTGWNPEKSMSNGFLGGFVYNEVFAKSGNEYLRDDEEGAQVLTYTLKLSKNGNFDTIKTQESDMFN